MKVKHERVAGVKMPIWKRLDVADIFTEDGKIHPDVLKSHFNREGRLTNRAVTKILQKTEDILGREDNMLQLQTPITICGDTHGQWFDLMTLFETGGQCGDEAGKTKYLFIGDYVDRGSFSSEIALYLFSLKIRYPTSIYLTRGNHESRHITRNFTFKNECLAKYNEDIYDEFNNVFDNLPLCAVVSQMNNGVAKNKLFCCHAGPSPDITDISDINKLDRKQEVPKDGAMCDLLWADPTKDFGSANDTEKWQFNKYRNCSYQYSHDAVVEFNRRNGITSLVRGHEAQQEGYNLYSADFKTKFPDLITIFSAPNYCGFYRNKAAILEYHDDIKIRQFNWVEHPYWLPHFRNAFEWSAPFIVEKFSEMLSALFTYAKRRCPFKSDGDQVEQFEEERNEACVEDSTVARSQLSLMDKINAIAKIAKEVHAHNLTLKGVTLDPSKSDAEIFQSAKAIDATTDYIRPGE